MAYRVKELFYTLQGEGFHSGRPAVFCRFAGCNLWNGLEASRSSAVCQFCDTNFVGTDGPGGGTFASADQLARSIANTWRGAFGPKVHPFVVCTGGEPLLQMDEPLIEAIHRAGFEIAVETNGTILPPPGLDWTCVSPKANAPLRLTSGDEFKLVFPQAGAEPALFEDLDFEYFFLQPMDGLDLELNTQLSLEYCLGHPQWRLSLQTHKFLGVP